MKGILGKKLGMSQVFDPDSGTMTPVTVIEAGPCPVVQVKTADALGYFAANKDLRAEQIASDAIWKPWATAIENAQGRTTDLGADYTAVSAKLSTAYQAALNAAGDAAAVKEAFQAAAGG